MAFLSRNILLLLLYPYFSILLVPQGTSRCVVFTVVLVLVLLVVAAAGTFAVKPDLQPEWLRDLQPAWLQDITGAKPKGSGEEEDDEDVRILTSYIKRLQAQALRREGG
jgi:hypothetical protein